MSETESTFPSRRVIWIATIIVLAILVAGIWTALVVLRPAPPRTVAMTTGPVGSAYAEFANQYRAILAREGIELELLPSNGAVENLARLRDPGGEASVGFVQGGISDPDASQRVASLGTVSYEPLWFFYRDVEVGRQLEGLRGKRIAIGPEGSGGRALAIELLKRNGIDANLAEWLADSPKQAEEKLLAGEIQAALMVSSWESPVVRKLLTADGVRLLSFERADAYVALYPYLNKLILPAGVADLALNRPPTDIVLLAPMASLAVRADLHPAIQYLLLDAAQEIHGRPGIFQRAGEFPAAESVDLPVSDTAREFYKSGRPFLQRYLPFWLAVLVGRLLVVLIPVVGVLYPLLRLMPALYGMAMRMRIFRLYSELKSIEAQLNRKGAPGDVMKLAARLERLDERAGQFRVPAPFAMMLYTLRTHIGLVRARFEKARQRAIETDTTA
jgi:TRAP-type uncharacterized transport system substrate-binding protein